MSWIIFLRQAWERRTLVLAVAVVGLLALAKRQHETITLLRAAPTVEFRDRIVEKRVVVRGPVHVVKVKAPDGTVTTTTDRAPETVTTDKAREIERIEVPPQLPEFRPRTRYFGAGVDPARPKLWRARTGLTVFGAFDAGMAVDFDVKKKSVSRPMIEITYRF